MRRPRVLVASLAVAALVLAGSVAPALAARPPAPYVSRITASALWVTDTVPPYTSWYVLQARAYGRYMNPMRDLLCVVVTYSDGTRIPMEGYVPRVRRGTDAEAELQFGEIPTGVTSLVVSVRVMRIGPKDCCTQVGPERIVEAVLPVRPAPPPAPSEPQVLFDVSFPAP